MAQQYVIREACDIRDGDELHFGSGLATVREKVLDEDGNVTLMLVVDPQVELTTVARPSELSDPFDTVDS